MRSWLIILLSSILLASACKTSERIGVQNLAYLYNRQENPIHVDLTASVLNDSTLRAEYRFPTHEMLFSRSDPESPFFANYSVSFRLLSTGNTRQILDSTTRFFSLNAKDTTLWIHGNGEMKARKGADYLLEVKVRDLNKNQFSKNFRFIYRSVPGGSSEYTLRKGGEIQYRHFFNTGDKVEIQYWQPVSKLFLVRFYRDDFPLPAPPFSTFNERKDPGAPDSVFWIASGNDGVIPFILLQKGTYRIQSDTSASNALCLSSFYPGYPEIVKSENMLPPLRYLTTKQEYEKIELQKNRKGAIDNFWIECAGNLNRAKTMIRNYYQRVQACNEFFTTYTEGWKTDRGMIYLIFGPPNIIYKSPDSENWIYGEENNSQSMSFVFTRVWHPLTENEYILSRNPVFKYNWYNAVEMWRR